MRRIPLALALLLAAGACAPDDATGPSPRLRADGALAAKSNPSRPFHADVSGTVTLGAGPADCPAGTVPGSATGGGTATHLGRFTIVSQAACLTESGGTRGEFTWRAASGDLLTGTFSFPTEPAEDGSVVVTSLEGEITGGTGRFAGASGTVTLDEGTFVFLDASRFTFDVAVDGRIRY